MDKAQGKSRHPRSAGRSLEDALNLARKAGVLEGLDAAAIGLARQSARALDDAVTGAGPPRATDRISSLLRAHLLVLEALGLTPLARSARAAGEVDALEALLAGADTPT